MEKTRKPRIEPGETDEETGQAAPAGRDTPGKGRRRVLLVDDEEMILETTTDLLDFLGYEVVCADSGNLALSLYREDSFDLVILDLALKDGMGGIETMVELSAIDPGVRAILSTGYVGDSAVTDFEEYGFAGVITKPYELSGLADTLEQVFSVDCSSRRNVN